MKRNGLIIGFIIIAVIALGGWYFAAKYHKPASPSKSTKAAHTYPWNSSSLQRANQYPQATNAGSHNR
jgi:hypothetical protein